MASGDYGEQWISMLAKAVSLSSDSDSSGLANDCSDGDGNSENIEEGRCITPTFKTGLEVEKGDKDVIVSLMNPTNGDSNETSMTSIQEDHRCAKYANQFVTLLKRSFLCISRDMVSLTLNFY